MPKPDTLSAIQRDILKFLGKAALCLNEADRLMSVTYIGTERWVSEVDDWKLAKDKLINCM